MPASAAPRHVPIDAVFERLLNEIPAATLNALGGAPSQLSWRDFIDVPEWGTPAGAKWAFRGAEDARAEWAKIREGQAANTALVRTWRVFRYMQRALSRGTRWEDTDKLVPQAEAFVDRGLARLSQRYPMLAAVLQPSTNWNVLNDLTAHVNTAWQRGVGTLYRQNDRGELERIDPTGRHLLFSPDRYYPEWVVVIEVNHPKDAGKFGAAVRRRLYLTHEDADALVAGVKQSLGLSTSETSQQAEPQDADRVEPEQRALADKIFERFLQPDPPETRKMWVELAIANKWAPDKGTIVNAYREVFSTEAHHPPKAGWPLQPHYQRKRQRLLSAESVSTNQTL